MRPSWVSRHRHWVWVTKVSRTMISKASKRRMYSARFSEPCSLSERIRAQFGQVALHALQPAPHDQFGRQFGDTLLLRRHFGVNLTFSYGVRSP